MSHAVTLAPIQLSLPDFLIKHPHSKLLVIADTNTRKHCYPKIKALLPQHRLVTIPAGEAYKTLSTCEQIWRAMTAYELDRHALVINLGGGVIGDMGGFCAATYKRGINFIQIPTTLLAQVDASVGGKLGIDFDGFKNHLGVFRLPTSVLIDPAFLGTLPAREKRSGFAEIIKHCLIADAEKWHEIRRTEWEEYDWADLIGHSVRLKERVVAEDPTEKGLRKILNFGHTLGHAVETYFLTQPSKKRLLHGEAIATGMIMESYIGYRKKYIDLQTLISIEEFIYTMYGKVTIEPDAVEPIVALTRQDKKNKGGAVRFSLLEELGRCGFDHTVTAGEMRAAIRYYTA